MPNIEIHGQFRNLNTPAVLERNIFNLFSDRPYAKEMVVTFCNDHVHDMHGNEQPFLRLANSCQEHTEEILERLETLDIDIEHLRLEKFIPRKQ